MDFEFTQQETAFRKEVEDFVKQELPPGWEEKIFRWPGGYGATPMFEANFKEFWDQSFRKLGSKGWLCLGWPTEYGGMASTMKQAIFNDVMSYYGAPAADVATSIVGPTILLVGSEEMKKEWLPRIAKGEVRFWLGYSEPNAGSDLSSCQTKAYEEGDDLIINGQKIWSSGAHIADYAWLLARTDSTAKKHQGLSLMIVDNRTPGLTIRPIQNICGIHSFNEVFFDDVRIPKKHIVGEINKGFYYLLVALQFERIIMPIGAFRRILEELVKYVKETKRDGAMLGKNSRVRDKLATMAIELEILYGFYWRTAWLMDQGVAPVLESSALKLLGSELGQSFANAAMEILGPFGQLEKGSKWVPLKGMVSLGYLDSVSGPIGAGTSEVIRGIMATRGLGLPRI